MIWGIGMRVGKTALQGLIHTFTFSSATTPFCIFLSCHSLVDRSREVGLAEIPRCSLFSQSLDTISFTRAYTAFLMFLRPSFIRPALL